ncbi:MAG TPA: thioredoxin domain-containing protein [Kofleriaceae bacterium]|nr:thioredoxin domain-containing protein [Kofleriaceae bacterium]
MTVTHDPPAEVPSLGPRVAPVTIEFFANLGDGSATYHLHKLLVELQERHPRRLRVLYRLVGSGETSNEHLEFALEAFAQGRFHQFLDAMYGTRGSPRAAELADAAREAGVDPRLVEAAHEDGRHDAAVRANHFLRKRWRVKRGPPALFVNGVSYDKRPRLIDDLEAIYDDAYARAKVLLDEGVPLDELYPRLLEQALADQPESVIGPGSVDGLGLGERPPVGPPPSVSISAGGSAGQARGPDSAPVPILFFCNFQTRNCAIMAQTLEEIAAAYPAEVRVVFHHVFDPRDKRQDQAAPLGRAAICAGAQGRFWSFYEHAFHQARAGEVTPELAGEVADAIELDGVSFARCAASRATRARLESDRRAARAGGIRHTPSIVVGGRLYTGTKSFDEVASLVDRELAPGVLGRLSRDTP